MLYQEGRSIKPRYTLTPTIAMPLYFEQNYLQLTCLPYSSSESYSSIII